MATEPKNQKPLEEAMQKLKVDPSAKVTDRNVSTVKEGNLSDVTSTLTSGGDATSSVKGSDVDQDSVSLDEGLYYPGSYYGYYYPGMDGSYGEWDDQGYFVSGDGFDYAYPGINPNDGSAFYYVPGGGYAQPPLTPYMTAPFVGLDGQFLGQQPYISAPFYSQVPSPGYLAPPVPYGSEIMPAYSWATSPFLVDVANVNGMSGGPLPPGPKSNSSVPPTPVTSHFKTMPFVKSTPSVDTKISPPAPELLSSPVNAASANIHHQPIKLANKVAPQANGFQTPGVVPKSFFPIAKFPPYSNALKSSLPYPNSHMGFKTNSRGWANGVKGRSKVSGGTDFDLLSEQNRGPRTSNGRDSWVSDADAVECLGAGTQGKSSVASLIRRDNYNLSDFPVKYEMALCFVIKSYSEDDVHKSIKYNVWASTPNGNKRLDSAYQDAQEWSKEKGSKCPVFLFFSVNASGQFCGVAEMTGRVDFTKSMDFWQQDKWNGFFSVKWHIIKDIPNTQFRHIILENNDNKPVTNSRDTQEVKFPQGIEMLGIFKNFNTKTSILDDFDFYEGRQKAMQDKKFLPPSTLEQPQKMPDEAATATVEVNEMKPGVASFGQPMGVAAALKKNNSGQVDGEGKV